MEVEDINVLTQIDDSNIRMWLKELRKQNDSLNCWLDIERIFLFYSLIIVSYVSYYIFLKKIQTNVVFIYIYIHIEMCDAIFSIFLKIMT